MPNSETASEPHAAATHQQLSDVNEDYAYVFPTNTQLSFSDAFESEVREATEVSVSWGNCRLRVFHLTEARDFWLGESDSGKAQIDFLVPASKLGASRLRLLREVDGNTLIAIPAHASGYLELRGGTQLDLAQVRAQARSAQFSGNNDGAQNIVYFALPEAAHLRLQIADLFFDLKRVPAGLPAPRGLQAGNLNTLGYFGLSFLSVGSLLSAMAWFVPPLGLTNGETTGRDQLILMQQFMSAAAERERDLEQDNASEAQDTASAPGGEKAPGEAGALGKSDAPTKNARFALAGPKDTVNPTLAKDRLAEAREFGMIGLVSGGFFSPNALNVPWGSDVPVGRDALNAAGNLFGETLGEAAGNGLGLAGIGDGGGGQHQAIGLGVPGTLGGGTGGVGETGIGESGFGSHHGRLSQARSGRPPRIRYAESSVSGHLPKEVVQRIVRQNFGRFRLCYEQGLSHNPNLQGRVVVQFMISRDGGVSNVASGGSSLPDANVVGCLVRAFYNLSFPKPESGSVNVSYPLLFAPE